MKIIPVLTLACAVAGCAPIPREQADRIYEWTQRQQQQQQQAASQPYYQVVPPMQLQPAQPLGTTLRPAATATWTGRSEPARSVTGATGFNCEYHYAGQKFWRMFASSCPSTVTVQ